MQSCLNSFFSRSPRVRISRKKKRKTNINQPTKKKKKKTTSPIQKSRAVKTEVPIMPVNNLQKFLLQDLECDSKILQHAEVWEE